MTNVETWNLKSTNVETGLTVENWMVDSKIWK
jgi:hypothetical protein